MHSASRFAAGAATFLAGFGSKRYAPLLDNNRLIQPAFRFSPLLIACLLAACAHTPAQRVPSQALPASSSPFGASLQAQAAQHPGLSGFRLLSSSDQAFHARAELAHSAQRSLDLQYYIVHDGLSTKALIHELLAAADRGVRVRLLLDDTTSDGQDDVLGTLGAHPNIQIRVFNPLHLGRETGVTRVMGRLFDLSLQQRRMHNKLWLADNSAAIVGGRNIGDEYFNAEPDLNFTDIDLLGVGPVAEQLGHSFDEYWNSALSRPIEDFTPRRFRGRDLTVIRQQLDVDLAKAHTDNKVLYERLMSYQTKPRLPGWLQQLTWAKGTAMWDVPAKVLSRGEPDPQLLLTTQLAPELNNVHHELILISAYFVPAPQGMAYLTGRADSGVAVSLLTNSLDATDVPLVHGGYAPYRVPLLEHGIHLYELRRQPGDGPRNVAPFKLSEGGSNSSLHSKAMVFDRQKAFVGSFNFDPRSVLWNTEVGVLVDSPELAEGVRKLALQGMSPTLSYQAKLDNGKVVWLTEDNGQLHTLDSEPGGLWRRFNAWVTEAVGLERML